MLCASAIAMPVPANNAQDRRFGSVAPPPLLLCCFPCRVTGIAGRFLFSLKQRISLCLFGRVLGCLLSRRALGVGCCLLCKLSLLRPVALFA